MEDTLQSQNLTIVTCCARMIFVLWDSLQTEPGRRSSQLFMQLLSSLLSPSSQFSSGESMIPFPHEGLGAQHNVILCVSLHP